jgi:hypothetical protein
MTRIAAFIVTLLLTCGAAQAGEAWDWEDIFAPYRQRSDRMTSSSGNAQNVNTATQVITFWPPQVRNRRIPANGERMEGAIRRYREGGRLRLPQMINHEKDISLEMKLEDKSSEDKSSTATSGSTSNKK